MPTTVDNLFKSQNLRIDGKVQWGYEIKSSREGIYVVTITSDENKIKCYRNAPLSGTSIGSWIALVQKHGKSILIDGHVATIKKLKQRLNSLWYPDETILYIGKVEYGSNKRCLRTRVNEYYQTILGCSKKHSGGNWINTLSILNDLYVFYSECSEPAEVERKMILHFKENVSDMAREMIFDKNHLYPFANKEIGKKERKRHGLKQQTVDCGKNWNKSTCM